MTIFFSMCAFACLSVSLVVANHSRYFIDIFMVECILSLFFVSLSWERLAPTFPFRHCSFYAYPDLYLAADL